MPREKKNSSRLDTNNSNNSHNNRHDTSFFKPITWDYRGPYTTLVNGGSSSFYTNAKRTPRISRIGFLNQMTRSEITQRASQINNRLAPKASSSRQRFSDNSQGYSSTNEDSTRSTDRSRSSTRSTHRSSRQSFSDSSESGRDTRKAVKRQTRGQRDSRRQQRLGSSSGESYDESKNPFSTLSQSSKPNRKPRANFSTGEKLYNEMAVNNQGRGRRTRASNQTSDSGIDFSRQPFPSFSDQSVTPNSLNQGRGLANSPQKEAPQPQGSEVSNSSQTQPTPDFNDQALQTTKANLQALVDVVYSQEDPGLEKIIKSYNNLLQDFLEKTEQFKNAQQQDNSLSIEQYLTRPDVFATLDESEKQIMRVSSAEITNYIAENSQLNKLDWGALNIQNNSQSKEVLNGQNEPVCTLTQRFLSNTSIGEVSVSKARIVDLPTSVANGPLRVGLVCAQPDGNNGPKEGAMYFSVVYDSEGKIEQMKVPPIEAWSSEDKDAIAYVKNAEGKTLILPITRGKYEELQRQVAANKGLGQTQELQEGTAEDLFQHGPEVTQSQTQSQNYDRSNGLGGEERTPRVRTTPPILPTNPFQNTNPFQETNPFRQGSDNNKPREGEEVNSRQTSSTIPPQKPVLSESELGKSSTTQTTSNSRLNRELNTISDQQAKPSAWTSFTDGLTRVANKVLATIGLTSSGKYDVQKAEIENRMSSGNTSDGSKLTKITGLNEDGTPSRDTPSGIESTKVRGLSEAGIPRGNTSSRMELSTLLNKSSVFLERGDYSALEEMVKKYLSNLSGPAEKAAKAQFISDSVRSLSTNGDNQIIKTDMSTKLTNALNQEYGLQSSPSSSPFDSQSFSFDQPDFEQPSKSSPLNDSKSRTSSISSLDSNQFNWSDTDSVNSRNSKTFSTSGLDSDQPIKADTSALNGPRSRTSSSSSDVFHDASSNPKEITNQLKDDLVTAMRSTEGDAVEKVKNFFDRNGKTINEIPGAKEALKEQVRSYDVHEIKGIPTVDSRAARVTAEQELNKFSSISQGPETSKNDFDLGQPANSSITRSSSPNSTMSFNPPPPPPPPSSQPQTNQYSNTNPPPLPNNPPPPIPDEFKKLNSQTTQDTKFNPHKPTIHPGQFEQSTKIATPPPPSPKKQNNGRGPGG